MNRVLIQNTHAQYDYILTYCGFSIVLSITIVNFTIKV